MITIHNVNLTIEGFTAKSILSLGSFSQQCLFFYAPQVLSSSHFASTVLNLPLLSNPFILVC